LVSVHRKLVLLCLALVFGAVLISHRSNAQWWKPHDPRDYEECSERAERNATSKETLASLISDCDGKFAGRRKPGGGYTYYDFMQNRHFDIAGPNPTPEELKQIDIQYTLFLDHQRQSILAAATAEKQLQQAEVELAKATQPAVSAAPVPIPVPRPVVRAEAADCRDDTLSCGWSRFTASIQRFKKTLLGTQTKPRHG
jgi:hypothetical protein